MRRGLPLSVGVGAGGVRSLAGLGMLRALEAHGARIVRVTGTSFGALVAVAFAFGVPDERIIAAVESLRVSRLVRPAWRGRGLLSHKPMLALIRSILPDAELQNANIPVSVWCTDLATGTADAYDRGRVCETVLASSLFAGLFDPVILDGRVAVDGGYTANVPSVVIEPGHHGLCIDVRRLPLLSDSPERWLLHPTRWRTIGSLLSASSDTLFYTQQIPRASADCTVFRPPLGDMGIAAFSNARDAFDVGRDAVSRGIASSAAATERSGPTGLGLQTSD